uniref:Phosphatidylcholine:ceramide cholinephosphotransferase 1 n=1 Tax=Sus scrofa TaxID=9823 RepID=A0A8D0MMW6_PIG
MKEVVYWSPKKVADWLLENAMPEYCEPLEHFTGRDLINLTQEDFTKPPLCRVSSDNGQRLLDMIETLKMEHHMEAHKNGHANGHLSIGTDVPAPDGSFSIKVKPNGMPNGYRKEMIKIPMPEPERSQYPMEWGKTFLAFLYALSCFVLTTVMISVVHERVPPKEVQPPLPDTFFDHFNRVQWAFSICEINGMILVGLWLIQWLLLKYKSIISRRFFCIVGTLYLYRCITMYVTTLPVPGMHFNCSPKLFGDWEAQLRRIMKLIAGGGLSITGSHNMCGDYLYSGHTVMLTLTYLFIKECKSQAAFHEHFLTCHFPQFLESLLKQDWTSKGSHSPHHHAQAQQAPRETCQKHLFWKFLLWHSGLRIRCCSSCGVDLSCSWDSNPGPETSICHGCG